MRFKLEQSKTEILTSHAGLALVGQRLNAVKPLIRGMQAVERRHGIPNIDLVRAYIGLLVQGKNDFDALESFRTDPFFKHALGIKQMPSSARLRQRFDEDALALKDALDQAHVALLQSLDIRPQACFDDWVPLDVDLYPLDNSNSKKEGVSRTYKGFDGYGALGAYLGVEGWCVLNDLRPGSQHPQKTFSHTLEQLVANARAIEPSRPLLLRADAAHDANETLATCDRLGIDYLIRWNPRQTDIDEVYRTHEAHWQWTEIRPGQRVGYSEEHLEQDGKTRRLVFRMKETTETREGQVLLVPEHELFGWWTNLPYDRVSAHRVDELYRQHATAEQFHSEIKTDMDMERLPSGKFTTNCLVMVLAQYAYNLLRWIGMNGLLGADSPKRKPAQRRRIRTVIQEIIYRAAKVVSRARQRVLRFGCADRNFDIFQRLYTG